MDGITLLRTVREDVAPPSPAAVEAGRQALAERIAAAGTRRPLDRRRALIAGAAAAVGAVSLAAVVASPTAPAADAADVLRRAARRASAAPLALAGSTIEITSGDLDLVEARAGAGVDVAAWRVLITLKRIPEPGRPWLRKRAESVYEYRYGDRSLMLKNMQPVPAGSVGYWGFERSMLGTFVGNPGPRAGAELGEYPDEIQDLPRDPAALLRRLQADGSVAEGTTWEVLQAAQIVLTSGVAPPDLRSAVFQALLLMPDLAIVDRHATDFADRPGVAIAIRPDRRDPADQSAVQLVIDQSTGDFLGARAVTLRPDGVVPAGALLGVSSVRYDVPTTEADWTPPEGARYAVYP